MISPQSQTEKAAKHAFDVGYRHVRSFPFHCEKAWTNGTNIRRLIRPSCTAMKRRVVRQSRTLALTDLSSSSPPRCPRDRWDTTGRSSKSMRRCGKRDWNISTCAYYFQVLLSASCALQTNEDKGPPPRPLRRQRISAWLLEGPGRGTRSRQSPLDRGV